MPVVVPLIIEPERPEGAQAVGPIMGFLAQPLKKVYSNLILTGFVVPGLGLTPERSPPN